MLYLETWNFPADINMALDVILGEYSSRVKKPILRLYSWEKPSVSIGRHQSVRELDTDFMEKEDLPCVRRPTGGRAVLHHNEITYSVAFPKGTDEYEMSVLALYKRLSEIFKKAFESIGISVSFSHGKGSLKNPSCFSSSARYELLIDGKKFLGSAQVRTKDYVLQHGSILLKPNWTLVASVFKSVTEDMISKNAIGIFSVKRLEKRKIVNAIKKAFDESYSIEEMDFYQLLRLLREAEKIRGRFSCQSSM